MAAELSEQDMRRQQAMFDEWWEREGKTLPLRKAKFFRAWIEALRANGVVALEPLNGIAATWHHDEGAIAQCGECGRYTLNPNALTDRPPPCDCGSKHGWSGSFKKPGPDAKWSGLIQPTTGVAEAPLDPDNWPSASLDEARNAVVNPCDGSKA